jgi:hypothetical protein
MYATEVYATVQMPSCLSSSRSGVCVCKKCWFQSVVKASKTVRTVVSSVSLMTVLTSDHLECCCSAVMICIQYHKPEQLLWCLHET